MSNDGTKAGSGFIDIVWSFLVLVAGYPIAFLILLTEKKSSLGFWGDLQGERGRKIAADWGESLVVAFILAMLIRAFLVEPFKIPSGSMRMTLIEGDRLFVPKVDYGPLVPFTQYRLPGFTKPKRGDIIVFKYPVTRQKDFIKRLVGLPGETVQIKDGKLIINGNPVTESPIADIHYYNMGEYGVEGRAITVPLGNYFVMGDNSGASHDSRFWGFVPQELVIGKADFIFWPPNRIRWIK